MLMVFSIEDMLEEAKRNYQLEYNDRRIVIINRGIKYSTSGTYEEYTVLRRIDGRNE